MEDLCIYLSTTSLFITDNELQRTQKNTEKPAASLVLITKSLCSSCRLWFKTFIKRE